MSSLGTHSDVKEESCSFPFHSDLCVASATILTFEKSHVSARSVLTLRTASQKAGGGSPFHVQHYTCKQLARDSRSCVPTAV